MHFIGDEHRFNKDAEMTELVLTETRGAISLLTFNRPEKLNALNYALIDRLMQILDQIEDDRQRSRGHPDRSRRSRVFRRRRYP